MNKKYLLVAALALLIMIPCLAQGQGGVADQKRRRPLPKLLLLGRFEVKGRIEEVTPTGLKVAVGNLTLTLYAKGYWLCVTPREYALGNWSEVSRILKKGEPVELRAVVLRVKTGQGVVLLYLRSRAYALVRLPPAALAWKALERGRLPLFPLRAQPRMRR